VAGRGQGGVLRVGLRFWGPVGEKKKKGGNDWGDKKSQTPHLFKQAEKTTGKRGGVWDW